MIGDNLEIYTFDYLINQALSEVPDYLDKRQGSVIYDALAPACARLAELYYNIRNAYRDTYVSTAEGEYLDNRAAEQGLTRYAATFALKKAYFTNAEDKPMFVPIGARFASISDIEPINYVVEAAYTENNVAIAGYYILRCETAGTVGNEYSGNLTNITHIQGLANAVMSDLITPARDEETDDELRARYYDTVNTKAYGGNIAQYNQVVKDMSGVGDVQIYPVWNGGGTVKLSVVDAEYRPCSSNFLASIQEEIDPVSKSGQGMGIAPIGHAVTVTTPTEFAVNISMDVELSSGYTKTQITQPIKDALEEYFQSVREDWGKEDVSGNYSLSIYIAKVVVYALQTPGVANVTNVKLNGSSTDLALTQNSQTQQLPIVGTVTINA